MLQTIIALRQALHGCAELSGQEVRTKAMLMEFLKHNTTLELYSCGDGFYAAHREENPTKPAIALRGDYDALAKPDGTVFHMCGHDGHAAALCGAALMAEGQTFGRNIFFLFQPAEETGDGAAPCCELFEKEQIDEIYGAHNLPGWPLGQVTTRPDTFACASRGVTLRFTGKPTHAAYPENGISPATAVGRLLCAVAALSDPAQYSGMTLCTVIGAQMGEKAFGAAAEAAEVWLTLRGEHDTDLNKLLLWQSCVSRPITVQSVLTAPGVEAEFYQMLPHGNCSAVPRPYIVVVHRQRRHPFGKGGSNFPHSVRGNSEIDRLTLCNQISQSHNRPCNRFCAVTPNVRTAGEQQKRSVMNIEISLHFPSTAK